LTAGRAIRAPFFAAFLLAGCAGLPPLEPVAPTMALPPAPETAVGRSIAEQVAANGDAAAGQSGVRALGQAGEAFAARMLLAATAGSSIDAQYYIWHPDQTGLLLFEALWNAAERGVRVRLLLDDNGTKGLDPTLTALDTHPNIDVRLYNPLVHRGMRSLNYVTDFTRANRRMHNKSFTVDNQATVVGGRNVGNEYFGAKSEVAFSDLDVLAVGAVVPQVSAIFDRFWNSPSAYPVTRILDAAGPDAVEAMKNRFHENRSDPAAVQYLETLKASSEIQALIDGKIRFDWSLVQAYSDDPGKTLTKKPRRDQLLIPAVAAAMGTPDVSFDLVSPYFVPREEGVRLLAGFKGEGATVRVLTNSLAATDVAAVHAGYKTERRKLLRAGIELYELKPDAATGPTKSSGIAFDSSSSLHAKTFAVDGKTIFVGSFNFDPRSFLLNTEMGLVIHSPKLAGGLATSFDKLVAARAYRVRLSPEDGDIEWVETTPLGEIRHGHDPETGMFRRLNADFMSILPIDWLL
jgi:putative cardiolipin synthase